MKASDIFYVVASVVLVLGLGVLWYAANELVITLRALRKVLEDVKDTTEDFTAVKNGLKVGALSLLSKFLGESKRGGEY